MSFLNRFLPDRPQDDILASVVRNLLHLLNSRREYGSLLCSFGLADYLAESGGHHAMLTVLREITDTILIYEPRLRVLSLKSVGRDDSLRLRIELEGMLLLPYWATACQLLIVLHPITGAVEIPRVSAAAPALPPASPNLTRPLRPVPLHILSAASLAAQVEPRVLLAEHPELAPVLVVARAGRPGRAAGARAGRSRGRSRPGSAGVSPGAGSWTGGGWAGRPGRATAITAGWPGGASSQAGRR